MTKPLFFKVTSDQLLLCVFLSLLWGVTDSIKTTGTTEKSATPTTTPPTSTLPSTTPPTTTPPTTTPPAKPQKSPENVKGVEVLRQTETSITLMWDKVNNISTYLLQYEDNGISKVENINSSDSETSVTHVVSSLTAGTKYNFTLLTVFEGINSTGYVFQAVTTPRNAEVFQAVAQNETSITLQWNTVDGILNYRLLFKGNGINVTASAGNQVTLTIPGLTSGTKYDFTLFTVFESVSSSGVNLTAVTAPENVKEVKVLGQNETSITLMWDTVDGILNYRLLFNGNEINVPASEGHEQVTHTIPGLTSGTKYDFTLFTVFENISSSGVNRSAATAPEKVKGVEVLGQNETSITLMWDKVNNIATYLLQYEDNGSSKMENITSSDSKTVTHVVSSLTAGTKYSFTLLTVFEGINSTGYPFQAVTAPRNAEVFQAVAQNETSITLQWNTVDGILNYRLLFNGGEINVTASEGNQVTHIIPGLTSGTKYDFTLFTVFENIISSGKNLTAVTAPRNAEEFEAVAQNETSITLQWNTVDGILNYRLLFNGREKDVTASEGNQVTHIIPGLTSGTKYDFTLFTVFENVSSSGVNRSAATVPAKVTSVSVTERSTTNITLAWNVAVDKDWSYFLQMNGKIVLPLPDRSTGVVSHRFTFLQPGREYPFSVITHFFGLNSTAYEDSTVTRIDCASVRWHVTTSSIQGMVEGLFTKAIATNASQEHVSPGGPNVSFTGLYPGATYELYLWYENNSKHLDQCNHSQTIIPPRLNAHCEHWDAGYSVRIAWDKPEGLWTAVEVNVSGTSYMEAENGEDYTILPGFLPAKHYEVSLASLSGTGKGSEQRSEPYVFSCATDPRGVIAGSVFGVLLFVVLVCLIAFILLKRPDIIRRKNVGSKLPDKKAISVAKFPDHFYQLSGDDNRGFSQEYESLIPVGTEQTRKEAILPENKPRNRFNNVLPYDWCRVKLSNPDATSDYINANYMPGYNSNREYIATQGPLPSTVNDFWRMIWEQKVKGIVMVTNCTEGGRTKCEQYWPADTDPCLYGELTVTMNSEQQEPNWTLREFRVKHSKTSEERTVRHFHFTAWPDHGVPQGTEVLIQFRGLVRQHIQRDGAGAPTVVHCSAGVGRTGTIIALDVLLQQLEKERAVGINAFVHKMRLSRPHMVQTESQYIFLHQCIMDCLQPKEKMEENIYENAEMIYVNATALREFHKNT